MGSPTEISVLESIASSQYVWAIISLILGFFFFKYLREDSLRREGKLIELYDAQKQESLDRENRLVDHLEKTTETLNHISVNLARLDEKVESGFSEIWSKIEDK